jgi:hypothetical protein
MGIDCHWRLGWGIEMFEEIVSVGDDSLSLLNRIVYQKFKIHIVVGWF